MFWQVNNKNFVCHDFLCGPRKPLANNFLPQENNFKYLKFEISTFWDEKEDFGHQKVMTIFLENTTVLGQKRRF